MRQPVVVICVFTLFSVVPAHARVGAQYLRWARGEFEMPPALKQAKERSQVESFLQSREEFLRMAAVRRLGEIEGPHAAPLLREVARRERSPKGPDYVPLVKLEVVRVLSALQGPEAESALIALFNDYWARRADLQRDRALRLYDFYPVGSILLNALETRSDSGAVFRALEGPALSPEVEEKDILPDWFRQRIWEVYLKSRMTQSGTVAQADQVEGLLDQLNLVDRQWPFGYLSLNHIKALAVRAAIRRYDDKALQTVAARLDQAIQTRSYENAPDPAKRRQELFDNRDYVRMVVRDHVLASQTPKTKP